MLKLFRRLQKDEKGFTLIELMVVVVIIGILAAIAVPQFSKATEEAKWKRAKADLRTIESAITVYYAENSEYPDAISDLDDYMQRTPEAPWDDADYWLDTSENQPYLKRGDTSYYLDHSNFE